LIYAKKNRKRAASERDGGQQLRALLGGGGGGSIRPNRQKGEKNSKGMSEGRDKVEQHVV